MTLDPNTPRSSAGQWIACIVLTFIFVVVYVSMLINLRVGMDIQKCIASPRHCPQATTTTTTSP